MSAAQGEITFTLEADRRTTWHGAKLYEPGGPKPVFVLTIKVRRHRGLPTTLLRTSPAGPLSTTAIARRRRDGALREVFNNVR